jgi:hypothetical protein
MLIKKGIHQEKIYVFDVFVTYTDGTKDNYWIHTRTKKKKEIHEVAKISGYKKVLSVDHYQ